MLKIESGKYKGKKLLSPSKTTTRATKSIVKASLFNSLQFDIVGCDFVEVFGGSGSVGLEALSRGASRAVFIERDKDAFNILRTNINSVDSQHSSCYMGDSFELFDKVLLSINKPTFFYFDPPFEFRETMQDIYDKTLLLMQKCPYKYTKKIIVEHNTTVKFADIAGLELLKTKKFGKTTLTYYEVVKAKI